MPSNMPPFVLPAGVDVDLSGDALSIRYSGDVELEQTLGRTLGDVRSGGDLTVRMDSVHAGHLRSGGKLVITGKIDADHIHGREVHLGSADIKCRAISADERIVIGPAKLAVDVIIAPEIFLDPKCSGRVTVIESHNDPGPTKIKGGFSLAEFEETVGADPIEYLAERGLRPLEDAPAPRAPRQEEPPPVARRVSEPPEIPLVEARRAEPPVRAPEPVPAAATPPMAAARTATPPPSNTHSPTIERPKPTIPAPQPQHQPQPPVEEDTSDPLSLSVDDLEPVAEPEPIDDELHPKLMDAVKRIAACYEGKETPPAVNQLRDLVESRDYDKLRENITEVWNGLLGFHQKKGIRPHHQVTHAFNVIHGLVQQG
jgi:hypothetical protein